MRFVCHCSYILLFILINNFSFQAFATITGVDYGGASVVIKGDQTSTTSTTDAVYGGVAGDLSKCTGTDVCDNCHGAIQPCNSRRITPNTNFTIVFKTDNKDAVLVGSKILFAVGTTPTYITPDTSTDSLATNTELTATVSWAKLCAASELSGNSACSVDKSDVTMKVGFDTKNDGTITDGGESYTFKISIVGNYINDPSQVSQSDSKYYYYHSPQCNPQKVNDGFCHFTLYKGDQKAYIENELVADTYNKTATTGINFSQVRFYYVQSACTDASSFDSISLDSPSYTTPVNVNGNDYILSDSFVPNLENGVPYLFKMANIDEAGNVFLFSPSSTASGGGIDYLNCSQHSVTPEEVIGLIDSNGCFIATAAYGTTMAKEIDILREFRSKILLKTTIGRYFTKLYYTYSPNLALKLKKNPTARALVRYTLWPIVNFAKFVLWNPFWALLLLGSLGFSILISLYFLLNNKRRMR